MSVCTGGNPLPGSSRGLFHACTWNGFYEHMTVEGNALLLIAGRLWGAYLIPTVDEV